jgi:signal transduction histidine kinase
MRNSQGVVFYTFIHDITHRKQLQTQLVHAQKMESVGQLAAGIAHEINTPTQFAGDNLCFLKDAFDDLDDVFACMDAGRSMPAELVPSRELWQSLASAGDSADLAYLRVEIPKAIAQSLDGVQRIAAITRAMKEFSHPGTVAMASIDLHRAIENTVIVCTNEWKYVAEVVTEFDPAITTVDCLPGELNQVILNLIVNAAQAIAEVIDRYPDGKGQITVCTRKIDDWAEISVSDNGPGIPEEVRQRVFDPFFTTKEVGKGTGQGLAIAHAVIVDKHQGTIQLKSEVGHGTTFIVRIPLTTPVRSEELECHEETCLVRG